MPLVRCPYFKLSYLETANQVTLPEGRLHALLVIHGSGQLSSEAGEETLAAGQVWMLPAASKGVTLVPEVTLGLLACELPS
jgi:hypothetical protein